MLTVLRTLVQPRLDYCSQLWSPRDQGSINQLESVQKHFVAQIRDPDLKVKTYWEKLTFLRVYSQERRRERYQICFIWKLSQGLVEGYKINWQWSDRRGRLQPASQKVHIPELKMPGNSPRVCMGPKYLTFCQNISEMKTQVIFRCSKITWTYFLPLYQTSPQPQVWPGLQPVTVCLTRSPL